MVVQSLPEQYCKAVQKALQGNRNYRKSIVKRLEADLQDYMADHPAATELEIREHFGDPAAYAIEYAETEPKPTQLRKHLLVKRVTLAVIAGIIAALILWGIGVGMGVKNHHTAINGYDVYEIN